MSIIRISALLSGLLFSAEALAFGGAVSASYSKPFVKADPSAGFSLELNQALNPKAKIFVVQGVAQNFYIDAATKEFEASDLKIGFAETAFEVEGLSFSQSFTIALGTSEYSRHVDQLAVPEWRGGLTLSSESGHSVGVSAMGRYYWSRFESAPGDNGEGGHALPHYAYALGANAGLSLAERVDLGAGFEFIDMNYHRIRDLSGAGRDRSGNSQSSYYVSLGVSVRILDSLSSSLSFSQGDALLEPGFRDYVLFDEETSSVSLSARLTF